MSFIVIAPAVRTLGPRAERKFAVTRNQKESRPHPEPLAGRKTGNQSEPWLPPNGGLHQLQSLLLCACL